MFVRDRMSSPALTVTPDTQLQDALKLMHERGFRRLPVVDKEGKLVGIASERDLLYASPSPATLSVGEMTYLLCRIHINNVMTREVVATTPDTPIEDAARLMADRRIGGLPVVDEHQYVVGVITETDIFKTLVDMFAGEYSGLRLTLEIPMEQSVLLELYKIISSLNGSIVSFGSFKGNGSNKRGLIVKLPDTRKDQLADMLNVLGDHVVDAREV